VSLNPYQIQFIFGMVSLVCTVPALYLMDKVGRRKMLITGSIGEFTCAFIIAFVGKYALAPQGTPPDQITPPEKMAGNAYIAFSVIFLALYSTCWGPTPWVFLSERKCGRLVDLSKCFSYISL
jgi:MFS transporter, SP family, sugar:H+ symporter